MLKVLLPVDGSENSNRAVKHLIHLISIAPNCHPGPALQRPANTVWGELLTCVRYRPD